MKSRFKLLHFVLTIILIMLLQMPALAVPQIMSYQGKLNDKNGVPVSGVVTMTFTIYDAATGGNTLWTETWTGASSVNVTNGIFNVALGSQTAFPATLFSSDTLYLGITVGTDAEMIPRQQITSGSYAFKSKNVEYNVPIGTIMAWAKNLTGVPVLPDGWVECDGQTLSDTNSFLNGQVIPNLNGANNQPQRFLRGNTTSGSVGGNESFSWTHRHADGASTSGSKITLTTAHPYGLTDYQGGDQDLKPPYYEIVWIMKVK